MYRFSFKRLAQCVLVTAAALVSGCSSNDSNEPKGVGKIPDLPLPQYESSSAKYDITSPSSDIASIELTGSGNYLVTPRYGYMPLSQKAVHSTTPLGIRPYPNSETATRATSNLIAGKFIKLSDTEYILEGYGSIVIEGSQGNAYSLQVTPTGGETTTVAATKASTMESSPITDAVCRTWDLNTVGGYIKFMGKVYFNSTMPIKDHDQFWKSFYDAVNKASADFDGDEDEDGYDEDGYEPRGYYPTQMVFTKAGTYMVFYSDGHLAVSTWRWENEKDGTLVYSWSYDPDDFADSNLVSISFSDTKLELKEQPRMEMDEDDDEDYYIPVNTEIWWLYTMTEVR